MDSAAMTNTSARVSLIWFYNYHLNKKYMNTLTVISNTIAIYYNYILLHHSATTTNTVRFLLLAIIK
jgi:hypothetical protein